MTETKTEPGSPARLRSLLSVAWPYRDADESERSPAQTAAARLTAKYTGKGIRGRPWTRLKRLAGESTEEALERIVQLIHCDNDCVSFGASKFVVRFAKDARPAGGKNKQRKQEEEEVNVKIMRFGQKGKGDAGRA